MYVRQLPTLLGHSIGRFTRFKRNISRKRSTTCLLQILRPTTKLLDAASTWFFAAHECLQWWKGVEDKAFNLLVTLHDEICRNAINLIDTKCTRCDRMVASLITGGTLCWLPNKWGRIGIVHTLRRKRLELSHLICIVLKVAQRTKDLFFYFSFYSLLNFNYLPKAQEIKADNRWTETRRTCSCWLTGWIKMTFDLTVAFWCSLKSLWCC